MIAQRLIARLPSSAFRASAASARLTAFNQAPLRTIASSSVRKADGPPILVGEGAKPGEVPSDEQQSTGLERFELVNKMAGVDPFGMEPLKMTRAGTTSDPIKIESLVSSRVASEETNTCLQSIYKGIRAASLDGPC